MATTKEIKQHLDFALKEVGEIKPWFDEEVDEWIFESGLYPVEYGGVSSEEVVKNYPKYLRELIKHRLNGNLSPLTEKQTKGHGGVREGAGRPKGSTKEATSRITLPLDLVSWFNKTPESVDLVRKTMIGHSA